MVFKTRLFCIWVRKGRVKLVWSQDLFPPLTHSVGTLKAQWTVRCREQCSPCEDRCIPEPGLPPQQGSACPGEEAEAFVQVRLCIPLFSVAPLPSCLKESNWMQLDHPSSLHLHAWEKGVGKAVPTVLWAHRPPETPEIRAQTLTHVTACVFQLPRPGYTKLKSLFKNACRLNLSSAWNTGNKN